MAIIIRTSLFFVLIVASIFFVIPICLIRPFDARNNTLLLRTFGFLVENILKMHVHIEGEEHLINSYPGILIGNHQHNFDAFTVYRLFYKKTVVLAKAELSLFPVFGQVFSLCGNIFIKRGHPKKVRRSMEKIEKRIKDNQLSVIIFPEGHRNLENTLLPFKKGAFFTAINTQLPLIPFSVSQFIQLNDFKKFHSIHIFVKVHPPVITKGLSNNDIPKLMQNTSKTISDGITEMNAKHNSSIVSINR